MRIIISISTAGLVGQRVATQIRPANRPQLQFNPFSHRIGHCDFNLMDGLTQPVFGVLIGRMFAHIFSEDVRLERIQ